MARPRPHTPIRVHRVHCIIPITIGRLSSRSPRWLQALPGYSNGSANLNPSNGAASVSPPAGRPSSAGEWVHSPPVA